LQVSAARIRSTLVARTADSPATASALPQAIGWLESLYLRARGDVVVSLEPGQSEGLLLSQIPRRRLIRLDADGPPEQVLHNAIRATLYRLSLRTGKRLGLRSLAGDLVVGNLAGRSELGSAGLD
jgi:hypothetical protein